jgi:hypothetical protein
MALEKFKKYFFHVFWEHGYFKIDFVQNLLNDDVYA